MFWKLGDNAAACRISVVPVTLATGLLAAGTVCAVPAGAQAPATGSGQHSMSASTTAPSAVAGNPNTAADSLRQTGGWRASKEIGTSVYNDQNQQVGTVDDLILSGDKVQMVVISVGGFLGMGSKLVAVPPDQLHFAPTGGDNSGDRKVTMTGATKEALNSQPPFKYR